MDLADQTGHQVIEWADPDIDWQGDDGNRGLRGIAFDDDKVYVAASTEILAYSTDFKLLDRHSNRFLQDAHGIAAWKRTLYVSSAGYDSVLGFDLDKQDFTWAMHVKSQRHKYLPAGFDPMSDDGPLPLQKLQLDNILCNEHGMYLSGMHTAGLLHFNGEQVNVAVEMPAGCRDTQPFRDGVLFNDSEASVLRYTGRGEGEEDRGMALPAESMPGLPRGLCALNDHVVAGGSTPATIAVYDLAANAMLGSVQLSSDENCSIHSIAVWPHD